MVTHKVLIVEDEENTAKVLEDYLMEQGFEVKSVVSGEEAVEAYRNNRQSIVVLDVKLSTKMNGFDVIQEFYKTDNSIPVIMVTGSDTKTEDQVKGHNLGAVHYLIKPVAPAVILAKINQILKPPETKRFQLGGYCISIQQQDFIINGDIYKLKEKEAKVLLLLLQKPGEVIAREQLLISVWGNTDKRLENHLHVTISKIKALLGKYPGLKIEKKYGVGYKIVFA